MHNRVKFGAFAAAMLGFAGLVYADVESGPPVGKNIPGAFHPTNVTGKQAGKKHCLV